MSDTRVQVMFRMWKADRKKLRRYAIQNDMTLQELIECALFKEMLLRGIMNEDAAPVQYNYRDGVVSKSEDGLWRATGVSGDGSAWCSVGFSTHAEAYRWLDRKAEEITSPAEKRTEYRWTEA